MKHTRLTLFAALRLFTLAAACATTVAFADEYADVSQLLRAGKLTEAMIQADVYLAGKPTDPQMRFLKGVIQRNAGKPAEAIATFTKLTEDYPELPEPYNNLAVLYAGQNQFDKARAALEMAIRTNPSYATAHENLGDIYARLASQAYNMALQLDGTNASVPPKLALIREVFKPNLKNQPAAVAALAAPASNPAPAEPAVDNSAQEIKAAQAAVHAWAKAWSSQDISAYLSAYGQQFDPPAKQTRSAWEQERRSRITGKSSISVKLENMSISVNGNTAVAKFRQDDQANALAVSSRKTLELVKTGNQWLIVRESTEN